MTHSINPTFTTCEAQSFIHIQYSMYTIRYSTVYSCGIQITKYQLLRLCGLHQVSLQYDSIIVTHSLTHLKFGRVSCVQYTAFIDCTKGMIMI